MRARSGSTRSPRGARPPRRMHRGPGSRCRRSSRASVTSRRSCSAPERPRWFHVTLPRMNLPDGIKHAVEIGASAFFECLSVDPSEEELENLGATYQGIGDDAASPADAQRYIADHSAWDDGSEKESTPGATYE